MLVALTTIALLLCASLAQAASPSQACKILSRNDPVATDRCATHARTFDTPVELIAACAKFSESLDLRFRCLKSGANLEVFQLCVATGWSIEIQLSCLRAYPTSETLKACKNLGGDETRQLQCVRLGRDANQITGCNEMMPDAESRIQCLQANVPAFNARLCGVGNKKFSARLECLEALAEERDTGKAPLKKRALASEPKRKP